MSNAIFQLAKKPSHAEYNSMYSNMIVDASKLTTIKQTANRIRLNATQYQNIINKVNQKIPYYALGIVHYLECNLSFNKHIHNGDALTKRTVLVPANRPAAEPKAGAGKPYSFEESCIDWLMLKKWNLWQDWGVQDILARLELNNGLGYRNVGIPSPYLWSFSNFYGTAPFIGKFVADSKFQRYDDKNRPIVSKQIGGAVLLKEFTL
jgi:lysozyme family protein